MTTSEQNKRRKREEIIEELLKLINDTLDMKRRGFIISYISGTSDNREKVIIDSEYCRISFIEGNVDQYTKSISVFYGRLHAPNIGGHLFWNGENCRAWHNIYPYILPFLTGITPHEDIENIKNNNYSSNQLYLFGQSEIARKIKTEGDEREYVLKLHGYLWDYYGQKLFNLFDIRQPQLWDQYRQFLSEYKKLLKIKPIPGDNSLEIDKVC